jgi:peroxiredoxin Q/BCP
MSEATPRIGDRAPDFALEGAAGATVTLAGLLARGPVVLYFYPRDQTAGCTIEACAFRDSYQDFVAAGAQVVGVSRDDAGSHARFAAAHRLPFPLLSDPGGEAHERYGVRQRLGGLIKDRVTFVIDSGGVIRDVFTSQLRFSTHVSRALEVVRALAAAPGPTA